MCVCTCVFKKGHAEFIDCIRVLHITMLMHIGSWGIPSCFVSGKFLTSFCYPSGPYHLK